MIRIEIARKSGAPIVIRVGTGELFRDTSVFYVRRDGLEAMIDEHLAGRRGHRIRLWVLLALAEWMDARR